MKFVLLIGSLVLFTCISSAQGNSRIKKNAIGVSLDVGTSFPNIEQTIPVWRGRSYSAGHLRVSFQHRFHKKWLINGGVGLSGYFLENESIHDNYLLDFISPDLFAGVTYLKQSKSDWDGVFSLVSGAQVGYKGVFQESFGTYNVTIKSRHRLYAYLRPEIGWRKFFDQQLGKTQEYVGLEFGAFFRYNITGLGEVNFSSLNGTTLMRPRGHVIGAFVKLLVSTGKNKLKVDEVEKKRLKKHRVNSSYSLPRKWD